MSRRRKAWEAWPVWADVGERDVFYAETASKARGAAYRCWNNTIQVTFREVIVRRAKHKDAMLPDEHRLVSDLTDKQRRMVAHAFGCDRHGNGHRDHYCTSPNNRDMLKLAWEFGLFHGPCDETAEWCDDHVFYYLTDLGKQVAASMLPTYSA